MVFTPPTEDEPDTTRRQRVANSDTKQRLGRIGLVSRGVVFLLMAALMARIAMGEPTDDAADTSGALATLADRPGGAALVAVVALGLAAHALWRFVQAYTCTPEDLADPDSCDDDSAEHDRRARSTRARTWVQRGGFVAIGLAYATFAAIGAMAATREATDGDGDEVGEGGGEQTQGVTAEVLGWPGGRILVGAVGIGFVVAALWNSAHGIRLDFEERLKTDEIASWQRPIVRVVAVTALFGRFGAFLAIGWFVVSSAVRYDPDEPMGLDQGLRELASEPWGAAAIGGVALGFACFGLLSFIEARWRKIPLD